MINFNLIFFHLAFAYPDPDDSVRDFFIDCEGKTRLDVGMQYCAFLIVLFEYTDTILHQNKSVILAHAAPLEHNTLASWWRGHLGTKRLSIYNETIKRSRTVLEELKIVSVYLSLRVREVPTTLLLFRVTKRNSKTAGKRA